MENTFFRKFKWMVIPLWTVDSYRTNSMETAPQLFSGLGVLGIVNDIDVLLTYYA
jgi:hypothetical protein